MNEELLKINKSLSELEQSLRNIENTRLLFNNFSEKIQNLLNEIVVFQTKYSQIHQIIVKSYDEQTKELNKKKKELDEYFIEIEKNFGEIKNKILNTFEQLAEEEKKHINKTLYDLDNRMEKFIIEVKTLQVDQKSEIQKILTHINNTRISIDNLIIQLNEIGIPQKVEQLLSNTIKLQIRQRNMNLKIWLIIILIALLIISKYFIK